MMSYQWRPNTSCFEKVAKKQEKVDCKPTPTWFYLLLGVAVIGGIASGKGKA